MRTNQRILSLRKKRSAADLTFDIINTAVMLGLIVVTFYPIWYVACASLSSSAAVTQNPGRLLWPEGFTIGAYIKAFQHPLILSGFRNILFILLCSLPLNLVMTLLCGYFMAAKDVLLKKYVVAFLVFTMFFSGGLIPAYLNQKSLGLYNNLWALIIPGALSIYNAIICRTAVESVPDSLIESAYIDGANDYTVLFKIITPLIKPTLAVLALYYGVGHWNSWFNASLYITDNELLPIQNILRAILIVNNDMLNQGAASMDSIDTYAETIKYAVIVIATLPILCVYPFLQKYFVKGVMIGAVKG